MKEYICECGKTFTDAQKFNGHKSHCVIHYNSVGKTYSMNDRVEKQKQTIIDKYGSKEEYSQQHRDSIKKSFADRTDTADYIISTINRDEFIHDYIDENKRRSFMREKYHIPSDYMMDVIVKRFECKKNKKQSIKLSWETKYEQYPKDNINNWKKGHETREKHYGSVENSYAVAMEKQKQTMLERYGTECILNSEGLVTHRKKRDTAPNNQFATLLDMYKISYDREFVIKTKSYDFRVGNTLIEVNPTPTHNSHSLPYPPYIGLDKEYHSIKSRIASEAGYRCIHLWDWDDKDKIVQLLLPRKRIYARNCIVKEISKYDSDSFCEAHHLQGKARDSIRIGLFYLDQLVSVMTFGAPRYNKKYEYELIRYCSSMDVIGGSMKLFSFFTKTYHPESIISYCDGSKFNGDVYKKLGFTFDGVSLGKHWYNMKTRVHITDNLLRQRGFDQLLGNTYGFFGKGTSNEKLMYEHGFLDIYDAGQMKYSWYRK